MIRRLKDRVPPAVRRAQKLPLIVLFVTSTLTLSPTAWARFESGDAEVRFVTESYSKDDLKKSAPTNPNVGIDQRIGAEMASLFNAMSGNINGNAGRRAQLDKLATKAPDPDVYNLRTASMQNAPQTSPADVKQIKSYFGLEVQKAARKDIATKFAAYTKMLNLARFNLNFQSLFGGNATPAPTSGAVRYGLVVKDIIPDTSNPRLASINDTSDEMQYAGHADVKWSIEPMSEDQGRKVFDGVTPDTPPPLAPDEGGWKLHAPSAKFHTDASTDSVEDYSKLSGAASLPSAKFELTQDEEFYKLTYRTSMQGKRQGVEHTVKLPIAGTVAVGRRFNDHFDRIETTAYNILYDKRLPLLSIHQMNIEQRYKADMSHTMAGHHTVGLAYRGDAKGPVENQAEKGAAASVNYTHDF